MKISRLFVMALVAMGLCLSGVSTVSAQDSQPADAPASKPGDKAKKKLAIKKPCRVAKHIATKTKDAKFLAKFSDWKAALAKAEKPKAKAKIRLEGRKACRKYIRAHRKANKIADDAASPDEAGAGDDADADAIDEGEEDGE